MNENQIKVEIEKALNINSETDFVEFKDARGGFPRSSVRKTLSAFGNTKGGVIVFGVEETKEKTLNLVGVDDTFRLQEEMSDLSSNGMNNVLRLNYFNFSMQNKDILAVFVPKCESHLKPYYCKELGLSKGSFVRDGNTDRNMIEEELKNYIRNAQGDDFDGGCADGLGVDDLSNDKLKFFLEKSANKTGRDFDGDRNYEDILKNIGVIRKCDGFFRPTIAGYLIFAKEVPQNKIQFERYIIRCVRYKGSGVHTDILDKSDIVGTLDEQIDEMQSFILRNIKKKAYIEGTKRVEKYEYPEKAIREIIANAVIHRDYRITETYTQVNIFEDRIEVFNPGNLPPGVTIENIKTAQMSRNKIIAARLNDMDYLEEYGRGIDIVFNKMSEWGLLSPIFKNTSNSFKVVLPGEKLSQLNDRQLLIWQFMTDKHKITRKEIEGILPNIPQATLRFDLVKMKKIGLIEQIGQAVNTYYEAAF